MSRQTAPRFRVAPPTGEHPAYYVWDSKVSDFHGPAFTSREEAYATVQRLNTPGAFKRGASEAKRALVRDSWLRHSGEKLARAVQDLALCEGVHLGAAFVLTIGRTRHLAIRYSQTFQYAGAPMPREALYVLSELPSCYVNRRGRRFEFEVSDDESAAGALGGVWYVAGYSSAESQRKSIARGCRYSGPFFLLFREDSEPFQPSRIVTCQGSTL